MKFIVTATSTWDPAKLVKSYPAIYDYGHELDKDPTSPNWIKTYIRIDTLAELIEFLNKIDTPIIISGSADDEYELEIYDDYRE